MIEKDYLIYILSFSRIRVNAFDVIILKEKHKRFWGFEIESSKLGVLEIDLCRVV